MPRITVGKANEDGGFLVAGFDTETEFLGEPCRWANKLSRLLLPASAAGGQVRLTVGVAPEQGAQRLEVTSSGRSVGQFDLRAGWQECALDLPAASHGAEGVEIVLQCSNPHDNGWKPQCIALGKVEFAGEPASETAPEHHRAKILWGDPHIHSNYSLCGRPDNGSAEENYARAREHAKLDFAVVTDHAMHMSAADWDACVQAAEAANEEGTFITFPAFEWTSEMYGHRNVYYRRPGGGMCDFWEKPKPRDLWQFLEDQPDSLVVPHHPIRAEHMLDWAFSDDSREPLVEIYSGWGSSEYWGDPLQERDKAVPGCSVRDALARGLRVGFVAGGDAHWYRPGAAGLTAVLAEELTREALWTALGERRCYATSGARIELDFRLNGHPMGSVLSGNQYSFRSFYPLHITAAVKGTAPIAKIEVISNGAVVHTHTQTCASDLWVRGFEGEFTTTFSHVIEAPGAYCPFEGDAARTNQLADVSRYYYLRVEQVDRHAAWSSPIYLRFEPTE